MKKRSKLRSVLCVEDDPNLQSMMRMVLHTMANLDVRACASMSAALATPGPAPDLILLGTARGTNSAWQSLALLRRIAAVRAVPVIVLAEPSAGLPPATHDGADGGRDDVLGVIDKPFDPLDLPELVANLWEGVASAAHLGRPNAAPA